MRWRDVYGSRLLDLDLNSISLSFSGKAQTAAVKRDAEIGVAQANRDAGIREAECEKAAMDVKYNTDTKIEDNSRAFKLQKAHFDKEVNTAVKTIGFHFLFRKFVLLSGSTHPFVCFYRKRRLNWLTNCKRRKYNKKSEMKKSRFRFVQPKKKALIRIAHKAEFNFDFDLIFDSIFQVVERRKQIEIEEQEIRRKEKELMSTVKLPAEAEAYKVQTIAEGKR